MSDWSIKDEAEFKCMKIFSHEGKDMVDACIEGVNGFFEDYTKSSIFRSPIHSYNRTVFNICEKEYYDQELKNACITGARIMYDWLMR